MYVRFSRVQSFSGENLSVFLKEKKGKFKLTRSPIGDYRLQLSAMRIRWKMRLFRANSFTRSLIREFHNGMRES